MAIATCNPASGEIVRTFDALSDAEIEKKIAISHDRWLTHRRSSFDERARSMRHCADLLEREIEQAATMMSTEMGKTLSAARAETRKCIRGMRYYAERAGTFLADEYVADPSSVGARRALARYQPLGPILAVMPWNFPLWQVMRFAAPALMAGNVCLLKHASNVPQCALYLEDLVRRGGFDEGCFQTLLISGSQVEAVLRDPRVAGATLTGSEAAGRAVAAVCGDEIKRSVMELGGSDPFVVMPSADLDAAARTAVVARTQNNGQSCIAAKRFIVHTDVYDAFTARFVTGMRDLVVGDPFDTATEVGPLATEQGRRDVEQLVDDARDKGATVLCGARRGDGPGWFYLPTVLADITPQMRVHDEEVFGPVATLYRVANIDEAIEIANGTSFGLGASAWSSDEREQEELATRIESGQVFINGMTTALPELPFGGIKRSGYGRELSAHGIREFCNLKTIWTG